MLSRSSNGDRHSSRGKTPPSGSSAALQATVSSSSHHGRDRSRSRSPSRGTPLDNVPPSGSSHSETSNAESSHDGAPRRQRNFKISHILIKHKKSRRPVDANDKPVTRTRDQAMSMMIDIHDQIAKDLITFADAAFAFSECASARRQGDIQKHFETGRVKQNFEDTAIALAPGQMSKVIESTSGYHILQRRE